MELLAKSDPKQTILEHTHKLLEVMKKIQDGLQNDSTNWKLLKIAIVLHDLGKANRKFQEKLRNKEKIVEGEIQHNLLSGVFIKNITDKLFLTKEEKNIIYKSVLFHHKYYLYYAENPEKYSFDKVQEAISDDIENYIKDENLCEEFLILSREIDSILNIENSIDLNKLDYDYYRFYNEEFTDKNHKDKKEFILTKGLLHLCDHIASSGYMDGNFYFDSEFIESIDTKLMRFLKEERKIQGKIEFRNFQNKTFENRNKNILTEAFTGSGKTIADHRWSGKRKFYLVPTKISAEAFYFDAEKIYGYDEKKESYIGIIHGEASLYLLNENEKNSENDSISLTDSTYQLTRNLSKPYIISTIDQICTAIFKYPGYEKTLAALKDANVTVDEIHLLSPKMYLLLLYLLSFLENKEFNTRFHLMTATMPDIYKEYLNKFAFEYEENQIEVKETDKALVQLSFKELKKEKNKIEFLKDRLKNKDRALVIVNTIKHAKEIYDILEKEQINNIHLLHSQFKFIDKKDKYKVILDNNVSGIWITTQLVEIALDIDFDLVISELSPLESQIQRMGRCNRHGEGEKIGEYIVFEDNIKGDKKTTYSDINKKIYELNSKSSPIDETKKIIKEVSKEKSILRQKRRKKLLVNYFRNSNISSCYKEEFEKANEEILKLFSIRSNTKGEVKKGNDLLLNTEPHLNLTDHKRVAQKLFRESDMNFKILLAIDAKEIKNTSRVNKFKLIMEKSITISKGVFYKLKKNNLINYSEKGIFVLDNSVEYTSEKGLDDNFKSNFS
ncbi:MAG: CRISPR-associated helicase Cas3' [Candidatus Delongbacteria bacterium]|jgi:CRISPR-associated endonuclease/helicase Cas3|nr:CRISPR-associated helicase Cas3' [Candidatus Delongbacteria bacterium]